MKGSTTLSTFGITVVVLGIVVGLGLRAGGAQTSDNVQMAPPEVQLPVMGLTKGDIARVHVTNLSTDQSAPARRFLIFFIDERGVLLRPQDGCEIRAGESCDASISTDQCPLSGQPSRCEIREMVLPETLKCEAEGADTKWSADVELMDARGNTRVVVASKVKRMPIEPCQPPGTDGGGIGIDGGFGGTDGGFGGTDGGFGGTDGGFGGTDGGGFGGTDGGGFGGTDGGFGGTDGGLHPTG